MTKSTPLSGPELFLLEAWVADNPGSRLFLKLGRAYRDAGRLAEASAVLQKGLVINPGEVEARQVLAQVLEEMGDTPGAILQLVSATREIARYTGVYQRLSDLWEVQGESSKAQAAKELARTLAQGFDEADPKTAQPKPPPEAPAEEQITRLTQPKKDQDQSIINHLGAFKKAALKRAGD